MYNISIPLTKTSTTCVPLWRLTQRKLSCAIVLVRGVDIKVNKSTFYSSYLTKCKKKEIIMRIMSHVGFLYTNTCSERASAINTV